MNDAAVMLVSAIISATVAYLTSRATGYSKDVIDERRKWRDDMRRNAIDAADLISRGETQSAEYERLVSEFIVRLNPDSRDDQDIVLTLRGSGDCKIRSRKLLAQVARLLKHDWERVKYEAHPLFHLRTFPPCKPNEANLRHYRGSDYLS